MKILTLVFLCFSFYLKAECNVFKESFPQDATWVKKCEGDKVYIKADRLTLSEDGIYLIDDWSRNVFIPIIAYDIDGVFASREILSTVWNIIWCNTCQAYRSVNIQGKCVVCGQCP